MSSEVSPEKYVEFGQQTSKVGRFQHDGACMLGVEVGKSSVCWRMVEKSKDGVKVLGNMEEKNENLGKGAL